MVVVYTAVTAFLLGPLVMPVPFPLDAEYPFSVNYTSVYVILYFHQAFTCFQCAGHTCLSLLAALLLFFTVARFECLAMEFEKSTNIDMLIVCIKKQLYLRRYEYILQRYDVNDCILVRHKSLFSLRYAEDVISCFRFVVLYAIIASTCALIFCGIIFLMVRCGFLRHNVVQTFIRKKFFSYQDIERHFESDRKRDTFTFFLYLSFRFLWYKFYLTLESLLQHSIITQNY